MFKSEKTIRQKITTDFFNNVFLISSKIDEKVLLYRNTMYLKTIQLTIINETEIEKQVLKITSDFVIFISNYIINP